MSRLSVTRVPLRACAGKVFAAAVLATVAVGCGSNAPTSPATTTAVANPVTTSQGTTARPSTSVSGLTAITVPGGGGTNYTCKDLAAQYAPGAEWFEVKLDRAPSGSHQVGDDMLSASITNGTALEFNWTSNRSVDAVFVKSGSNGHNLYLYNTESTGDSGLTTPTGQDISHISFCYDVELQVSKTVATTFKRDFDWTLVKSVDQPAITVASGGQAVVNYNVTATKDNGTDSDWAVSGTISVTNPHKTLTASNLSIVDSLSNHGAIVVACPSNSLAPLASMTCSYGAVALANGTTRTNTGSADSDVYGIVKGEGSASVAFVTPTTVFDNAVNVTDSYSGAGTLATGMTASRTFNYARTIQASQLACGANTIGNTASLATDDGVTRTATANVAATLTCTVATPPPPPPPADVTPVVSGCGYSQGYWSTHSKYGPAKYNAIWAKIGEDTPFYLSGNTYIAEINVNAKGNAYHILASQYIAAKLNMFNGAAAPAGVDMAAIDAFYKTYTPAQVDKMKGSDPIRKKALDWSTTLDAFNNGKLNVKHCG